MPPPELPSGTVTLLFTDIQDSTPLFLALGDRMLDVIDDHNRLIREAFIPRGGVEVKTEGDALIVGFTDASEAIAACLDAQRALRGHPWPDGHHVKVRMGLHTGPVTVVGHDYIGVSMAVAARVSAAAHGEQVLLSDDAAAAAGDMIPGGAQLRDRGEHVLKGFPDPRRLYELVHPDLPADLPPPRTETAVEHNLPVPPTALVGRDLELRTTVELLRGDARLVTLTGPGGIGKTRLALEVARAMLAYMRGGAWFVELAPITDPDAVLGQIARALGVSEEPSVSMHDAIVRRVSNEPTLLLLDNFEQVLDGALAVAELLSASGSLKVLATSRERLRLRGEYDLQVEPLPLPANDLESVRDSASAQLFVERALMADASFTLGSANAGAVAAVCLRCDGIPLALELAGARVGSTGIGELAAELGARIELLSEGARDLPERHQTLDATIAWSYDALPPDAQRLFRTLSVFAGGASDEAIVAVWGVDPGVTLDLLVERSLARANSGRTSLLEPLRQFGLERLTEAGERATVQAAHAAWFEDVARRGDRSLTGPDQQRWLALFDREIDNFRVALAAQGTPIDARLEIAGSLGRYWDIRGAFTEGRAWLDGVLTMEGGSASARCRASIGAGALAMAQGDHGDAERHLEAARSHADTPLLEGTALKMLAGLARARGDLDAAAGSLGRAREAMERASDERGTLLVMVDLGTNHIDRGDLGGARAVLEQARPRVRRIGDRRLAATVAQNLGLIAMREGDLSEAESGFVEALAAYRGSRDRAGTVTALTNLGVVAARRGRPEEAVATWEEALHEARAMGSKELEARLLVNIANLIDDPRRTLAHFEAAASIFLELDAPERAAPVLAHGAGLTAAQLGDDAWKAFARANEIATASGDGPVQASVLQGWGEALAKAGRERDARALLEQALRFAREAEDDTLEADITASLDDLANG